MFQSWSHRSDVCGTCNIPAKKGFYLLWDMVPGGIEMNAKSWKHGLLVVGAAAMFVAPILTSAAAVPQDAGQNQSAPAAQNAPSKPDLNLTDDQKAQMKQIHQSAKSQVDAVKNDSTLSADQKQQKIQQIHRDSEKQVHAMLTPEQRKQMKAYHQEKRAEQPQPPAQQQPPSQ
jgi:periplasmic protein CpxP/Spy